MKLLEGVEFNPYYSAYINLVSEKSLLESLKNGLATSKAFYTSILENKWDYCYAEGKWTIKEIVQHLIDAERVFAYRSLCIARKERNSLPGFDHDLYLKNSNANSKNKENLIQEYEMVRKASIALFETFNTEMLKQIGIANNSPISVRALGYIIAGHEKHHNNVIFERYL